MARWNKYQGTAPRKLRWYWADGYLTANSQYGDYVIFPYYGDVFALEAELATGEDRSKTYASIAGAKRAADRWDWEAKTDFNFQQGRHGLPHST